MKPINIRGKLKGLFVKFRLDVLFMPFANFFVFFGYLTKLSRWVNKNRDLPFNDFYSGKFNYNKRYDLFNYVVDKEGLHKDIDYLEFGVAFGESIKWWTEKIKDENSSFAGFDTFSGLPEDWSSFKKGEMTTENKIPQIDDNRCTFYPGLFQQTLNKYLQGHQFGKRTIIHIDADLYSSTLFVLTSISPFLKKGDIVFFDEFNVVLHEFKAFTEWGNSFYIDYEVLGAVNDYCQVAIKIK
jgi:hypothetical protein